MGSRQVMASSNERAISWLPASVAFTRTCYKCGNLGHRADLCQYAVRLCYNCKQPGHESSQCPNGRSSNLKQCYYCKEMGHIQTQCSKLQAMASPQYRPRPPHFQHQPPYRQPCHHDQINTQNMVYYSQLRYNQQQLLQQQLMYTVPYLYNHQAMHYIQPPPASALQQQLHLHDQHYNVVYSQPVSSFTPRLCDFCGEAGHTGRDCAKSTLSNGPKDAESSSEHPVTSNT